MPKFHIRVCTCTTKPRHVFSMDANVCRGCFSAVWNGYGIYCIHIHVG